MSTWLHNLVCCWLSPLRLSNLSFRGAPLHRVRVVLQHGEILSEEGEFLRIFFEEPGDFALPLFPRLLVSRGRFCAAGLPGEQHLCEEEFPFPKLLPLGDGNFIAESSGILQLSRRSM